jgi:general secretion pathway protein E
VASQVTVGACAAAGVLGALDLWLRRGADRNRLHFDGLEKGNVRETIEEVRSRVQECVEAGATEVSSTFDEIVRGAMRVSASDIHLTPSPSGLVATYRVHGTLHEVCSIPAEHGKRLATRVKVLARLDPYARKPQDGRLTREVSGVRVEARVSTLPAEGGQRIVLRLVSGSRAVPLLSELGFEPEVSAGLAEILSKPQGLLFVTGPVGSGKTTTLYSAMQHISQSRGGTTSLVTLEDPIELQLSFATQTQINAQVGMTFAQTLRSVLRQDPNVLMIGEIRDRETAEIAAQAGLTGHLLLTTVHADTTAGIFARLIEMDVEPFILASAAAGSLSQRLVRTLCTNCRKVKSPEGLIAERLEKLGVSLEPVDYYEPVGCEHCEGQGFTGRVPIAELLVLSADLRHAIHQRLPTAELQRLAVAEGMVPLLESGLVRARRGETSLSEVLRVAG